MTHAPIRTLIAEARALQDLRAAVVFLALLSLLSDWIPEPERRTAAIRQRAAAIGRRVRPPTERAV